MHIAFLIVVSLALATAAASVLLTLWWAASIVAALDRAALDRRKAPPLGFDGGAR